MDKCTMQTYAEQVADELANLGIKVRGLYRKPLMNEWFIDFHNGSGGYHFQIRYTPQPNAYDKEHVEIIKQLLLSQIYSR